MFGLIGNKSYHVYHESQESNLCARHCLNNLLQGPYFSEMDLAKIAQDLDREEQQLLRQNSDDDGLAEWLKNNQESQNVSMDGNFSVQVLRKALDNLGLQLYQLGGDDAKEANESPENETGFICNLMAHWFSVRKINDQWYDLNSLSGLPETKSKPTTISNFYLSAYLSSLKNQQYSIFVVRGQYPKYISMDNNIAKFAKWYKNTELKSRDKTYDKQLLKQVNKSKNGQSILGQYSYNDDSMLQAALQASLMDNNNNINKNNLYGNHNSISNDEDLQTALALSMTTQINENEQKADVVAMAVDDDDDEDELLRQAIQMSMEDENKEQNTIINGNDTNAVNDTNETNNDDNDDDMIPEEPDENDENSCEVSLKLPNTKKLIRRFNINDDLSVIQKYIKINSSFKKDTIFISPPTNKFDDNTLKLKDVIDKLGSKKISLIVKEID